MYLRCSSNNLKFKTATILFYALCLLYVLSTATVVIDLVTIILQVSNNPICKNIIFYQLCSCISLHFHLNLIFRVNWTHCQCYIAFGFSKP